MASIDYWKECISIAAEDCGLKMTDEQLDMLAGSVESGHENYGMAFYSPPAGEHIVTENARLKRELATERDKIHCKTCNGSGRTITYGPYHSADSQCWKCNGDGRHKP